MMDMARISVITNGEHRGANPMVVGLVNDSRKDCENKLYVAIAGPNFDGHQFIQAASDNGASAALVEHVIDSSSVAGSASSLTTGSISADIPSVKVTDSVKAIGQIAAAWRNDFDIPVLGITGSAGKTTVKELSGSILSVSRRGTVTQGNLNNEIGVPLTLTRLSVDDEFAVVEMGMNHAGEIKYLSSMASPTVAIINNAAPAHLDDLGTVEAVAHAKGEIIEGLADDGVLVINNDDHYCSLWQSLAGSKKVVTFGLDSSADIYASYEASAKQSKIHVKGHYGEFDVELNLPGEHNVRNALAVIAATIEMGCSIEDVQLGLKSHHALSNRGGVHEFDRLMLIDDTYNANPAAMKAAFDTLALQAKELRSNGALVQVKVVLGDMAELGNSAAELHQLVGSQVKLVADEFYCYGKHQQQYSSGFGEAANGFDDFDSMVNKVLTGIESSLNQHKQQNKQKNHQQDNQQKQPFQLILVKGSRSAGMENAVKTIINAYKQHTANTLEKQ